MEAELCSKCEKGFEKGSLVRDEKDAALLYCEKCRPKKKGRPKKEKKAPAVPNVPAVIPIEETSPVISMDWIQKDVMSWAKDCGMKDPLYCEGPTKENFPQRGYGFVFIVQEKVGKQKMATARYDARGRRSYWSMDGIVTG